MSADEWYWRHGERMFGPLTWDELHRCWTDHRIAPGDEIRLGRSTWEPASQVFGSTVADKSAADAADAARRALAARHKTLLTSDEHSPARASVLAALVRGASSIWEWIGSLLATLLGLAAPVGRLVGKKTLLAVLVAVLVAILFTGRSVLVEPDYRGIYEEYVLILEQTRERAARQTSAAEWAAFEADVQSRLAPLVQELERHSERRPSIRRSLFGPVAGDSTVQFVQRPLLQIGRYSLPTMIQNGRAGMPLIDARIAETLEFVRLGLEGEFSVAAADRRVAGGEGDSQEAFDPMTAGIVLMDAFLLVGGILVWRHRRRAT